MTEWMFRYGRGSGRGVLRVRYRTSYLQVSPKANRKGGLFTPLLSVSLWLAQRSGVGDAAKILVEKLREVVRVPLFEPLVPFVHEF